MKKKKNACTPGDKAFTGSDKHALSDLTMQPWTPHRIWTAALVGMQYPNLGKEGREQFRRTSVYPAAVLDVSIFLYLSTLTPAEVDEAERNPDEARANARELAIKRGIHKRDSKEFWDAYNKFWEVMSEIEDSGAKPKSEGAETETDEDEDPPNE